VSGARSEPAPKPAPRWGAAALLAAVALSGCALMSIELAAVRLVAPWFGTSLAVWTNVLGAVLLGLSLGYLLGARWCARRALVPERHPAGPLAAVLGAAALWAAALPASAAALCTALVPSGMVLDRAAALLGWGSLAAALCLFTPAALLMGCVQPLAADGLARAAQSRGAGRASGLALGLSTLGSLIGTFATSYVLIPRAGLLRTHQLCALLLALGALCALAVARAHGAPRARALGSALVLALGLTASALLPRAQPRLPDGQRLLAQRETPYQLARVVEDEASGWRYLRVNEGVDSFQSIWKPGSGLLGEGHYYDAFALPLWWSGLRGRCELLLLGAGAGTALRVLQGARPSGLELAWVGLELDPGVLQLGRELMQTAPDEPGRELRGGLDARAALAALPGPFDYALLDTYANQVEIPPHLATLEFFGELRARLRHGGFLAINVGAFGCDDPLLVFLARTLAEAFDGPVLALRVPAARNCMLYARAGVPPPQPGDAGWRPAGSVPEQLLPPLELPGSWRWFAPPSEAERGAALVASDDHNPIEALQRASLELGRARARGELTSEPASAATEAAPQAAAPLAPGAWRALLAERRLAEALRAATGESDPAERALGRVEVLYRARDFAAVLREARAARSADHAQPRVCELAAASSLWLREGELALEWLSALEARLARASVPEAERVRLSQLALEYGEQATHFERQQHGEQRALGRARSVGGALLGLCACALLGLCACALLALACWPLARDVH